MDNGLLNGVHFLDLKKSFDTVDHVLLLRELNFYRVDSISLKCSLIVSKELMLMALFGITVPLSQLTPRLYADDTCLTLTSHDPPDLQIKLNSDLNKFQSWLQANKLSLNVK